MRPLAQKNPILVCLEKDAYAKGIPSGQHDSKKYLSFPSLYLRKGFFFDLI